MGMYYIKIISSRLDAVFSKDKKQFFQDEKRGAGKKAQCKITNIYENGLKKSMSA